MSYIERLRTLNYTSPSGQAFTLHFDDLRRSGGKKAPVTETPGHDTPIVQDLGESSLTYPVVCYVSGDDYDQEADRFWDALSEPGEGTLHHPRWGEIPVIPTTRVQREAFVEGGGTAIFEITFVRYESQQLVYPRVAADTTALVRSQVDAAISTALAATESTEGASVSALAAAKKNLASAVKTATKSIDAITGLADDVRQQIQDAVSEATGAIDAVTGAVTDGMSALIRLYRLPAQAAKNVQAKIEGLTRIYQTLAASAIDAAAENGAWFGAQQAAHVTAVTAVIAESTSIGSIPTRSAAVDIVAALAAQADALRDDIVRIEAAGAGRVPVELLQAARETYSVAVQGVIERGLRLPKEQTEVLDRDETPITLSWRYYGNLDKIDELIQVNEWTGDSLLLIPRGSEVVHYA